MKTASVASLKTSLVMSSVMIFLILGSFSTDGYAFQKANETYVKKDPFFRDRMLPQPGRLQSKQKSFSLNPLESLSQRFETGEWVNEKASEFAYNTNSTIVTRTDYAYQNGIRYDESVHEYRYNLNGFPVSYSISFDGEERYSVVYTYRPSGRVNFVSYFDSGFELSRAVFTYVNADSIRVSFTSEAGLFQDSYFSQKNGNLIEGHNYDFFDRTIYYGITLNDYLRGIYDRFFFFEMLNERRFDPEGGFIPHRRIVLTTNLGQVTEELIEEYNEFRADWIPEEQYFFEYNGDNVISEMKNIYDAGDWEPDKRTFYDYGVTVANEFEEDAKRSFQLYQNYPNPFNPSTMITFRLDQPGRVDLKVYNTLGVEVASLVSGNRGAGIHQIPFNASDLSSGFYYYRLQVNNLIETRSMILLK